MYFKSKKISLLILGITSVIFSRTLLLSFNDPEGPNLLIVSVLSAFVFALSLCVYRLNISIKQNGLKMLGLAIVVQIVCVLGLYVVLK